MKASQHLRKRAGLYILGSLYPYATGGMEIFNYYFLNHQLAVSADQIYYLGEKGTDAGNGHFFSMKKRWPVKLFYPFQFFFSIYKVRKLVSYAYLSYAEQSWIIAYAQSLTLRFFSVPYIITIHWGKEPDWKFSYPYLSYFRHAHAVIGVSEHICVAFKKTIPDQNFTFIPPLIPFKQAPRTKSELRELMGFKQDDHILLFVGSLKAMKNPDKVVESLRIIGKDILENLHIQLVFAGNGDLESEIRGKIAGYGLTSFIRVEGLVKREFVPDYYKIADAYIISSDYEGTSLSLLEAMYNRLAIIASNAPGINNMVKHEYSALLYETMDPAALADSIKRIFGDKVLAEQLANRAFEDFNLKYSYQDMINKYKAVFSSVSF
ncbi:MAG TPA: glycosyltransferase family 4 protein [Chitinophagaceae bacterium]